MTGITAITAFISATGTGCAVPISGSDRSTDGTLRGAHCYAPVAFWESSDALDCRYHSADPVGARRVRHAGRRRLDPHSAGYRPDRRAGAVAVRPSGRLAR